jgi:hypothetical protein
MRYQQIKPLNETELKRLDELRMNPSALMKFAASPAAKGIVAGFEAELVFSGLGGEGGGGDIEDYEPDYDHDPRPQSIEDVMDFFGDDEHGFATTGRDARQFQEKLEHAYYEFADEDVKNDFDQEDSRLIREYILENVFIMDDEIESQLDDMDLSDDEKEAALKNTSDDKNYAKAHELAEEKLQEMVIESINEQDQWYDGALDEFRQDHYTSEADFFRSSDAHNDMSSIASEYGLNWPIQSPVYANGGFSGDSAERLADDLSSTIGVSTTVSSDYHNAERNDTDWIFEPDSSLEADNSDMPIEIISPPMPLLDCLEKIEQFFKWAESNNAYANESTGFHMGVSLPELGGKVDFVTLALFLGDEHVLKEFGRASNTYCEAAMVKIKSRVTRGYAEVPKALEHMRNNMLELAQSAIAANEGFGKYTSINPQSGRYIEFRSAGGPGYFDNIQKLQNTLMRYAQAMHVAGHPELERREYYKKLYKLIAPVTGDPTLDLFAQFVSGSIDSGQLKQQWASAVIAKPSDASIVGNWEIYDDDSGHILAAYNNMNRPDAWHAALTDLGQTVMTDRATNIRQVATDKPMQQQRADLAKRIKAGPVTPPAAPATQYNQLPGGNPAWAVYKMSDGLPRYRFHAADRNAALQMGKDWVELNDPGKLFDYSVRELPNVADTDRPAMPGVQYNTLPGGNPAYAILWQASGTPVYKFHATNDQAAYNAMSTWVRQNDPGNGHNYEVRPLPATA